MLGPITCIQIFEDKNHKTLGESSRYSTQVRLFLCDLKITIQAAQAPAKQAVLRYALLTLLQTEILKLDPLSSRERQRARS